MVKLPIGVDDFSKVKDYYYVDKTLFIKDVLDYCRFRTILFTKPRRFGKTLNLSMIEHYFTNHNNRPSLFDGLSISSCGGDYRDHQGRYPVVHLNFKDISSETYEDFCRDVINEISRAYRAFPELVEANTLFDYERNYFLSLANQTSKNLADYGDALKNLTNLLYNYYDKAPCIVLVDEYDTPLSMAYKYGYFPRAAPFFRKFYSSFSKSNPYIFFVLLTGVTEISKESIFSEMNNVDVYTVADEEFSHYFGFTEGEIEKMADDLGLRVDMEALSQWYGGYGADGSIFNPWSVLNYLNRQAYEPYWVNTGTNFAIRQVLGDEENAYDALNDILNNGDMPFVFFRGISYDDLRKDKNILFSLLVHAGYLSLSQKEGGPMLRLPNIESKKAFEREILSRMTAPLPLEKAKELRTAIKLRDALSIQKIFGDLIDSSFSYLDLTKEKEYQSMVVALLAILFGEYSVKSEVNGRYGRCDVLLSPKRKSDPGIVIEIKKHKTRLSESKIKESEEAALRQIKKHRYYQDLLNNGAESIYLYAFVFDGAKMRAKEEVLPGVTG